ncbi:hypothetical protein NQZ68_007171 [Dissostichus eleginoides]|nr:hypothetical protein NQZ68_007171 [Dissostichus eleginoides]
MLGVAQWQAKGNQNQMVPGLGPSAEAAVGPSRSWLLSSGCPGRKECKSGCTGVVLLTAHHCTASHTVDWQRDSRQTQKDTSGKTSGVRKGQAGEGVRAAQGTASALCQYHWSFGSTKKTSAMTKLHEASSEHAVCGGGEGEEATERPASPEI